MMNSQRHDAAAQGTINRGYMHRMEMQGRDYRNPRDRQDDNPSPVCLFFVIFKKMISVFFIVGDKILDWSQFAEMQTITNGTQSGEKTTADTGYIRLPDIESSWKTVMELEQFFKGGGINCQSGTKLLTIVYGITCFLGSVYAIFQIINMVGETVIECKFNCWKGFQLLHGWVETIGSVFFEEIPQAVLLFFFSASCKNESVSLMKILMTMIVGNMKNFTRKSTCKQKKKCCSDCCVWQYKFGCIPCSPCVVCYTWTICQCNPGVCCKFEDEIWAVAIDFPSICTCCTWTLCGAVGCCGDEKNNRKTDRSNAKYRQCCKCKNRCKDFLGDIDTDPDWAERLYNKGSLVHYVGIVLTLLVQVVGPSFFSFIIPSVLTK